MVTTIHELPVAGAGLSETVFPSPVARLAVTAAIEQSKNGGLLKHAMFRIPGGRLTQGMPELFQELALAIEPQEPAFQYGFGHPEGPFWHLVWPTDWRRVAMDLCFQGPTPMSPAPLAISISSGIANVTSVQRFHDNAVAAGLEGWKTVLIANLSVVIAALNYLDLQTSRDLVALQETNLESYAGQYGVEFMGTVATLLEHRLGACPRCNEIVCPKISADSKLEPDYSIRTLKSRQASAAHIYPVSKDSYYGRFHYVCGQCSATCGYSAFLRILEPAPALPNLGAFCGPFASVT